MLDYIIKKRVAYYKDIINDINIPTIRSILLNLKRYDAIATHKTSKGTLYIATRKTRQLLETLSQKRKRTRVIDPKMLINWGVFEWLLQTLALLRKEGITMFSKGLFFHKLYEMCDRLEREGYIFERPKLVSVDRCIRYAVEWGILERKGSHKNPLYVINEEKLDWALRAWKC